MGFHIYISVHRQSSTIPLRRIHRYLRAQLVDGVVTLHQAGQTVAQMATRFALHYTTLVRRHEEAVVRLRNDPADLIL
jgi:hypothetical protein avisC_04891